MSEVRTFSPMTIGELIEELLKFPSDCRVMVKGYESGYDDPEPPRLARVRIDPYDSSVYGDYEDTAPEDQDGFPAVIIDR